MAPEIDYDKVSYVVRSTYREQVLLSLTDGYKQPVDIKHDTDIVGANVSRALGNLREHGLVKLLVDEETTEGRLYDLTDEGRAIAEEIKGR